MMETDPNMVSDVRVTYMEMMCILKTERTESSVLLTDSVPFASQLPSLVTDSDC